MQFSGIFGIESTEWTMSSVNLQKKWPEYVDLKKKLSLFEEVAIFSIISFKISSYWYCEIMQFSGIFGIESTEWTMSSVNLQKKWSECDNLKKKLGII